MTLDSPVPVIAATDVRRRYGERVALDGLSLEVPAGAVFGLLGPNGSGKSTFISLVAAMEQPEEGRLSVFGGRPSAMARGRVGTVFQENAQDPLMTVGETLGLAGRLFGLGRAEGKARGTELLGRFGLEEREREAISTLSGGMRRRLEMARALLHDPELLLLDEPTTGVDPEERRALWQALLDRDGRQRTVLLATNDLTEADAVCDRVAFMSAGRVVATGTPAELKRGLRRETVHVTWDAVADTELRTVATWPGVAAPVHEGDTVQISADDASALVPRLFELAPGRIRAVRIDASSLEDAYFEYVAGAAVREEAPV